MMKKSPFYRLWLAVLLALLALGAALFFTGIRDHAANPPAQWRGELYAAASHTPFG